MPMDASTYIGLQAKGMLEILAARLAAMKANRE